MPNHVTNKLTMSGDAECIEEVKVHVCGGLNERGEAIYIDFDKIIKMPEELDITAGTRAETTVSDLLRKTKEDPAHLRETLKQNFEVLFDLSEEEIDLTKKYINNHINHGVIHWYDWRIKNWGTKWGAYSQQLDGNTIKFQTAWSTPQPVIKKLSELFPNVLFSVEYADEDIGTNCGGYSYQNGELTDNFIPNKDEAAEFACEILEIDPAELAKEE
jgi:hypothetical protein